MDKLFSSGCSSQLQAPANVMMTPAYCTAQFLAAPQQALSAGHILPAQRRIVPIFEDALKKLRFTQP